MDILSRQVWGARDPKSALVPFTNSRLTHIVDHWPGDARNLAGLDSAALLRVWQAYHQNVRGWKDIGYNYAFDQAGRIWEARGWNVGGHVLTTPEDNQNARSVGFLYMVGNDEEPTSAMLEAAEWMTSWVINRAGKDLGFVGHSDWANKLCPGPRVLRFTRAGHVTGGAPVVEPLVVPVIPSKVGETATPPAFPLGRCRRHGKQMWFGPKSDLDHQVSGWANTQANGTRGSDNLQIFQARLAYRGWNLTPDGLWGDETETAVRKFQTEKGLVSDGAVGPKTWAMAWTSPIT